MRTMSDKAARRSRIHQSALARKAGVFKDRRFKRRKNPDSTCERCGDKSYVCLDVRTRLYGPCPECWADDTPDLKD